MGNVTVNTYDGRNRLLSTTTLPSVGDSIVVSYAYDQVGNRTRQTDGRDCVVRFTPMTSPEPARAGPTTRAPMRTAMTSGPAS